MHPSIRSLLPARALGICGILGGIALAVGDQLLYWGPASNLSALRTLATGQVPIATMGLGAEWRLIGTAVLAMLAAWLYMLGSGLLYYVMEPAGRRAAALTAGLFALLGAAIGVGHAVYFGIGAAAKAAYLLNGAFPEAALATALPRRTFNIVGYMIYIPALAGTVLVVWAALRGRTRTPRWALLFLPTLLVQTQYVLVPALPENLLKVVLMAGYVNLSMALFFTVFTALMWTGGREPVQRVLDAVPA